jgi:hypothetical protein
MSGVGRSKREGSFEESRCRKAACSVSADELFMHLMGDRDSRPVKILQVS